MTPRPAAPAAPELLHLTDRVSSWDELADVLRDDWLSVRDGRDRCLIRLPDGLGLVEHPGLLHARERRGLHRSGFRLQHADGVRVWVWAPPGDERADPRDLAASLRRWQARGEAVRRQALRTVRDVLGAQVQELAVVLLPEEDDQWEDDLDEDPCGCCAGPRGG